MRGPYIATITGNIWYPFDPRVEDVRLDDVRALAYQTRFLGHAGEIYAPIQHMVHVAEWLEEQGADAATVREGLGHDMHEYVPPGDVAAPCKRGNDPRAVMLREWEAQVAAVVRPAFGLPLCTSPDVHHADLVLLATEIRDLNPAWPGAIDWGQLPEPWDRQIEPWEPEAAWSEWLQWWKRLDRQMTEAKRTDTKRTGS